MIQTFSVKNGKLIFDPDKRMILRLVEPASHGDWKDNVRVNPVPVGSYVVEDVWDNYYGTWIRIRYSGYHYDIEPKHFEWHLEDQH